MHFSKERSWIFMSPSVIIDLLILLTLSVSTWIGWKKGMVRGILTLAGMILALTVASQAAELAADLIVEQVIRPATQEAVNERISEMEFEALLLSPLGKLEQALNAIESEFIREEAGKLLDSLGLSADTADSVAKDKLLTISSEVIDAVLYGAVTDILSALLCILLFLILSWLLRPVIWSIDKAFRLPILRQVNQTGGTLLGAARGILLVFLAVWALRLLGIWITEEMIDQSYLLQIVVDCLDAWNLSPTGNIL